MTRNKSITVKTLHSILRINVTCMKTNNQLNLSFVNDDQFEIQRVINKVIKECDRLCFIDYSVSMDDDSIFKLFDKLPGGYSGMVFPAVKEGINWDMFKQKIATNSTEPIEQMGLDFDTVVEKPITEDVWNVKTTHPRFWVVDTKPSIKALRNKKGEGVNFPLRREEMFTKIKICAFVKAKVIVTYTHECVSNILQSSGVSLGSNEGTSN